MLEIVKSLILGRIHIDTLEKTSISRTPGDVTDIAHN